MTDRIDGRTRAGRAQRDAFREEIREPIREGVPGRNGEVLRRTRVGSGAIDPFHIPEDIVPEGWEYQWNVVTVVNSPDLVRDQSLQMWENGWRPVPAERHPGRWADKNYKGAIERGGLRLEERPTELCEQARNEEVGNARRLISDRNEQLELTSLKNKMPDGFDTSRRYRGAGGDVRMSIDKGLDIPRHEHQLAEPDE